MACILIPPKAKYYGRSKTRKAVFSPEDTNHDLTIAEKMDLMKSTIHEPETQSNDN